MQTCGREKLDQKSVGREKGPMRGLFKLSENLLRWGDGNLLLAT